MTRLRAAIVGLGRLGRACVPAAGDYPELELAGTVQRGNHVRDVGAVAAMEAEGHGVLLERRGTSAHGAHPSLLLEGRFDPVVLAARTMLDAARYAARMKVGAHAYHLSA